MARKINRRFRRADFINRFTTGFHSAAVSRYSRIQISDRFSASYENVARALQCASARLSNCFQVLLSASVEHGDGVMYV